MRHVSAGADSITLLQHTHTHAYFPCVHRAFACITIKVNVSVCASVGVCVHVSDTGSFGIQHLSEQFAAWYLSIEVFIAQVILSLCAQNSQLSQMQQQLTESVHMLRIHTQCVFQQCPTHSMIHLFHIFLVFQQLHIWQ